MKLHSISCFAALRASTNWGHCPVATMDFLLRNLFPAAAVSEANWEPCEPHSWAMMSDVGSFRAGVPDALIEWRRARGEAPPKSTL